MSKLNPKVAEFKEFVKRHPNIVKDVRANKKTWQELYEDWYMFGEEDSMWEKYKSVTSDDEKQAKRPTAKKESDFMSQLLSMVKNIDMNELQKNLNNVSGAISNVQQLLEQFQNFKGATTQQNHKAGRPRNPYNPFFFQKD
ncbi:YlbD family protein [Calidifontibacillus oryziterrae]|uniref:YlbD family protein n=1 Tax=Calidifontibacillus oryziterrae TaxID=1191699 RepID=UPI000301926D|nr:YlbD family protein [Calidifontibacillus oryziterrae]